MSTAAPREVAPLASLPLLARIDLLALAAAIGGLSLLLWPDWRHNPDLSHGFFMPVVFVLLIHEARQGPPRFQRSGGAATLAFALLLAGALAALVVAGLYAAALDWSHELVKLALTGALVLGLGASVMVLARDNVRAIPLNWSLLVALGLWLLSTPIPPGTYTRLTLGLQLWVTENVLRALHTLGVPAIRHGNIIELARGSVGIEEACSGIRSLISCVFAGFFFSASLVRRTSGRILVIALAAPLALLMNFIRSLTLTLMANAGMDVMGTWHDLTGFAVLGLTAAILGGVALILEREEKKAAVAAAVTVAPVKRTGAAEEAEAATGVPVALRPRVTGLWVALTVGLGGAGALVVVFVLNTRSSPRRDAPVPDLLAVLPAAAPGWRVETSRDLYQFRDTLQTDTLAQRTYTRIDPGAPSGELPEQITLYIAYWRAGQAPVSLVASHTPDACWPGAGWTALPPPDSPEEFAIPERALAPAEYRLFRNGDFPQYVWFWHLYDGRPILYRNPYSPADLLGIAWRYGFRHDGDQVFVRVSSTRPWSEISREALVAEFFAHTRALGL